MTAIKDILKLDLKEDIKNVIDLEDRSEDEIQSEIESYIVTNGLGKHLSAFIDEYNSNIKETGVWLSGFYGSGKSYFGKMLGYLINNPVINGTRAIDRFLPRLNGVTNQALIENNIRKLESIKSKVIFLDVAKQNTENGLAFTLFANFLKSLGFRDDVMGYYFFHLYLKDKYDEFSNFAAELCGEKWQQDEEDIIDAIYKVNEKHYRKSEQVTANIIEAYNNNIRHFSASKFKEELGKYLDKFPGEVLIFIFDETSEAISQRKFTILDLEGLAESLSGISKKVWTIAIAQEKLDTVIRNAKVPKSQLARLTDRFKTKIHLESTEVDVIIRNRLLQKKEGAYNDLIQFFHQNDGLVSDTTNLKSTFPTKTETAEQFATYYPFHKYQFDLLQKFLFSSNALVSTQIAARGMIITTFDVLRKELRDNNLYHFSTAWDICTEAQPSPPANLVNKYSNAKSIVENAGLNLDGENLLKTIHFINESGELVLPTIENITKLYISDIQAYYSFKPEIEQALSLLVDAKILLLSNNNYKITSNLESKLLEEMRDFSVELFVKKRDLVDYLKKLNLFRQVAVINEDSVAYNFRIITDLDDEIVSSGSKNLKLTVYSLFNINEDRQDFIENLKIDTQYAKDVITLAPDNSRFHKIDKLLDEVNRYSFMEEKYGHDNDASVRQIIREFSTIKNEKIKDLTNLIEAAYANGSLIYLFDENLLNRDSFKGTINEVQRKLIKNIYTKRLGSQLSEEVGAKLLSEKNNEKLHRYFSGDEFKFFDANGNFTGEHLKVVEEITAKIKNKYIDGKSLEMELSIAPWGYSYGTISTTLAVLFRAGRLVVKYNDTEYFSWQEQSAREVFSSSTKFKTARFKSITKTLTAASKNEVVQLLLDLEFKKHTGNNVDWNSGDFELSDAITVLAEHFISTLNTLKNTQFDFTRLFGNVFRQKDVLQEFSSKTTEANYIDKVERFLQQKADYSQAVKSIVKAEKFIKKNLDKIKGYQRFVEAVQGELNKAGITNSMVVDRTMEFEKALHDDVIERFADIQNSAQAIRDEYFKLMDSNAKIMSEKYAALKEAVQAAKTDLENHYPENLNRENLNRLNNLQAYCNNRILSGVNLQFHIVCQDSGFSLSDILNYIELAPSKEAELQMIKGNFVKVAPPVPEPGKPKPPKQLQLAITKNVMTAAEYRKILDAQIQSMAGLPDDEKVEVKIKAD